MRPLTILGLSLALFACAALCPPVWAGPEEGGENEIEARIKEQMAKIIRLMEANEQALLEVSTGARGDPEAIDVPVPPGEGASSQGGSSAGGEAGTSAARKLEKLIETQRGAGPKIPGELEELVRLVPQ